MVILFTSLGKKPAIMAAGSISEDEYWDSIIFFLTLSSKIDSKWTIVDTKVRYVVVFQYTHHTLPSKTERNNVLAHRCIRHKGFRFPRGLL